MNTSKPRLLIYIIAFNHEQFIVNVLRRIPLSLSKKYEVEILINDDSSKDSTFDLSYKYTKSAPENFKFTILYNPINQGYGGNQKIGYHYAIKHNFDFVVLLHGDGQYAPEYLEKLVSPLSQNNIDAVFGSRMITKGAALKGGMPLWRYIGNKILTKIENSVLGINLSEFHSGYRAFNVSALKKLPFEKLSNDFQFDTEIIIQFVQGNMKISEVDIPTHYAKESSSISISELCTYSTSILINMIKFFFTWTMTSLVKKQLLRF